MVICPENVYSIPWGQVIWLIMVVLAVHSFPNLLFHIPLGLDWDIIMGTRLLICCGKEDG